MEWEELQTFLNKYNHQKNNIESDRFSLMEHPLTTLDIEKVKLKASPSWVFNGGNKYAHLKATYKLKILERDNFKCVKCGRKHDLTIDHLIPPERCAGGSRKKSSKGFILDDCQILCILCHYWKNLMEALWIFREQKLYILLKMYIRVMLKFQTYKIKYIAVGFIPYIH